LSQKYPPSTKALIGALLDELGKESMTGTLQKSLNPITKYNLSGADKVISSTEKWNIV
jgi:hypothetical protein